jgi:hypothetical protein
MPVSSATRPARPPQPSWRMRWSSTRIGVSRWCADASASFSIRSLPQRAQLILRKLSSDTGREETEAIDEAAVTLKASQLAAGDMAGTVKKGHRPYAEGSG